MQTCFSYNLLLSIYFLNFLFFNIEIAMFVVSEFGDLIRSKFKQCMYLNY